MELQFYTSINGRKIKWLSLGWITVISPCYRGAIALRNSHLHPPPCLVPFLVVEEPSIDNLEAADVGGFYGREKSTKKKTAENTPRKMNGWNLKITQLKRKIIFQTIIFRFHVNLPGCTVEEIWLTTWDVTNLVENGHIYHINWCRILSINRITGN